MADSLEQQEVKEADDLIGQASEVDSRKKGWFTDLTIFDAMLFCSLILITAATILLVFELRTFGNFPFEFVWRPDQ